MTEKDGLEAHMKKGIERQDDHLVGTCSEYRALLTRHIELQCLWLHQ